MSKYLKILFISISFCLVCCALFSQTNDKIIATVTEEKSDSGKINILLDAMDSVYLSNPKLALKYGEFAEKLNNRLSPKHYEGEIYSWLGFLYEASGDIEKAIEYLNKGIVLHKKNNNIAEVATGLLNLGMIYHNRGEVTKALESLQQSLKLHEQLNNLEGKGLVFNNLGTIYFGQKDLDKAEEYFEKALAIRKKIGDDLGTSYSLACIGVIHKNRNNFDKAIEYYNQALQINTKLNDKRGSSYTLNQIGMLKFLQKDYAGAKDCFTKSLEIRKEIQEPEGISQSHINLAGVYYQEKKYKEAKSYALEGLTIAKQIGFAECIRDAANTLYKIYSKTNEYENACKNYDLYIRMRDSITNEANKKATIKNQLQYEFEKKSTADSVAHSKEKLIATAQMEKQNSELKYKRTQQYFLVLGLVIVLAFSLFMYNRFRIARKQKLIIESQKLIVEEKQKEILDSIYYARRIQRALMPNEIAISKQLNNQRK